MHVEVLPPQQVTVLRKLAPAATEAGFYLGGGTAVALHLGHRRSLDFDWFSDQPLVDPAALAERLRRNGITMSVRTVDRGTLHADLDGVAVSFLEYTYRRVEDGVSWSDLSCDVASLADLACMKLSAAASRGSRKDFVDIFAIGRSAIPLERMLALYTQKYDARDITHVLASLCYFDDAMNEPMPEMLWSVTWDEIAATLEGWVRRQ
jgi:hypothetical protein